ncbi:translation initiation factor IF-2 N-terminal domain-containing protein [Lolliginicoccus suaedae]|uniref:translation initiation factor IF-2 N-terminal domain-containing protein n=1 Tax=Lolliginicoccus suaedae TaxID=2605429 RepID=UPI001F2DD3C1|nr:translation initiation factor IF-2 N-terminal domain-containing protein [Lolliginicoccus suaedae]
MADHVAPDDATQPNTSGEPAAQSADSEDSRPVFPAKMRVHALAKLLGQTSKQLLASLKEQGHEMRSAHSTVERALAEQLWDDAQGTAGPAGAAGSPPEAPDAKTAQAEQSAGATGPEEQSAGSEPPSLFSEPAAKRKPTGSSKRSGDEPEINVGPPLFLSPPEVDREEEPRARTRTRKPKRASEEQAPEQAGSPKADDTQATDARTDDAQTEGGGKAEPPKSGKRKSSGGKDSGEPEAPGSYEPRRRGSDQARGSDEATESDKASESDRGDAETSESETDDDSGKRNRRRRRGRRGRGRGKGEASPGDEGSSDSDSDDSDQQPDSGTSRKDSGATSSKQSGKAEASQGGGDTGKSDTGKSESAKDESAKGESSSGDSSEDSAGDDNESDDASGSASSRRRRRRRRRRGSGDDSSDATAGEDPPNTVVHEREPRSKSRKDEVQGISGSTRLEAKRQRRRDGREAVRRRPPILTEAEFLARRESVERVMVVREKRASNQPGTTTQIGVLEDGMLVEHFVTSAASGSIVGNIYLGRVQNVLPSMEAAFVDIGRGRNGVLYAGEVNWDAAGLDGGARKIEQALRPGDQVLVQVSKDPVGHKGARLTTQVSLAGRFLVYVPEGSSTGISRKLPDNERRRLKEILREIIPDDAGVIVRTASEGVPAEELARDVDRLQKLWASIAEDAKADKGKAPRALYEEPDLLVKVVRDMFNEDFAKLVVQGDRVWETVEGYVRKVAPDLLDRVHQHEEKLDVFERFRIDEQISKALDRKVWLPSGGTLVIDRTEAMTVIDVNTGKFTGSGGNLEETVTRNNLESAEEIVRQLRLRDVGGMIVIDFIDMVLESNRDLVLRRLTEALARDRTRHQVSEVTSLGLVQMTRKRIGTGLVEAFSTTCEHCHGRGLVMHDEPVDAQSEPDRGASSRRSRRTRAAKPEVEAPEAPSQHAPQSSPDDLKAQAENHSKHPMILAMSTPQEEEEAAAAAHGASSGQAADASAAADVSSKDADSSEAAAPEQGSRPSRSRRRSRSTGSSSAAKPVAETQDGETQDAQAAQPAHEATAAAQVSVSTSGQAAATAPAAVEDAGSSAAASASSVVTREADTETARPPRRRRVQRPAGGAASSAPEPAAPVATEQASSAPAAASAEAATVAEPASAEHAPAVTIVPAQEAEVVARPVQRRRRRAAGRPSGPPVDAADSAATDAAGSDSAPADAGDDAGSDSAGSTD